MQAFINKNFFYLFTITYVFGILLYDIIGFQWSDEICALILVFAYVYVLFKDTQWTVNRVFLFVIGVFLFYLIYSFRIHSNSAKAIVMDFIIQLKPYLAFFCVYQLKPLIDEKQKKLLNSITLLAWFVLLVPVGLIGVVNQKALTAIMGHVTSFAGAVTITSLIYLFTSEGTLKHKLIFIGLLSLGLISGRAKFYGFFIMASVIVLYFNHPDKIKFSAKNILLLVGLAAIILFVAKDKIIFYFSISGDVETDYLARLALYVTSISIFQDYFPFGCGFGSFATYASGVYYSDIYPQYGIDNVWGLNKTYTSFVADTYYPSLAQFGVLGVVLYTLFWFYIIKKGFSLGLIQPNLRYFAIIVAIVGFFFIENIADSTFTGNRGLMMMMMLGYIISNLSIEKDKWQTFQTV